MNVPIGSGAYSSITEILSGTAWWPVVTAALAMYTTAFFVRKTLDQFPRTVNTFVRVGARTGHLAFRVAEACWREVRIAMNYRYAREPWWMGTATLWYVVLMSSVTLFLALIMLLDIGLYLYMPPKGAAWWKQIVAVGLEIVLLIASKVSLVQLRDSWHLLRAGRALRKREPRLLPARTDSRP